MVLGRERRQERREDRREARQERRGHGSAAEGDPFDGSGPSSYDMREKILAFGNDFEIKKASRRQGGRIGPTAFYVVSINDFHLHSCICVFRSAHNVVIVIRITRWFVSAKHSTYESLALALPSTKSRKGWPVYAIPWPLKILMVTRLPS